MLVRFVEFFEGEDRRLSMTRLLCFLSFFPTTYTMVRTQNENMFSWFLSAYVTGYVLGKAGDIFMKPKGEKDVVITDSPKV